MVTDHSLHTKTYGKVFAVGIGLLINATGYNWIDPATSLLILLVIVYGTWQLLIDSINLSLDAVPKDIDYEEVKQFLAAQKHIREVHDLHIWAMSTTENILSVHLVAETISDDLLKHIKHELHDKFGIIHTTIQLEQSGLNNSLETN